MCSYHYCKTVLYLQEKWFIELAPEGRLIFRLLINHKEQKREPSLLKWDMDL